MDSQEQTIISYEAAQEKPTLLSSENIIDITSNDFSNRGIHYSRGELADFVSNRVTAAKVNGDNIISIDFEHNEKSLHPITRDIINSPNTRVVVNEYFYPEIQKYESAIKNKITGGRDYGNRLNFSKMVADICRQADKPVAVADIANKPSYIAFREIFEWLLLP